MGTFWHRTRRAPRRRHAFRNNRPANKWPPGCLRPTSDPRWFPVLPPHDPQGVANFTERGLFPGGIDDQRD